MILIQQIKVLTRHQDNVTLVQKLRITEQLLKDTLNSLAKLASAGSLMFFLHLSI